MSKIKGEISAKELEQMMIDIFNEPREPQPRSVIIGRNCKALGYILDDGTTIGNYCNNPECQYCNTFHTLLGEEAKRFIADDSNFIKPCKKKRKRKVK